MADNSWRRTEGLTLVEVALIVCVVGVLLAVFLPMFIRTLSLSKVGEASQRLEELHLRTAAYYARRGGHSDGRRVARCLPPHAGPAPAMPSVDPIDVDFGSEDTPGAATWTALGFQPDTRVRYRYTFLSAKEGCLIAGDPDTVLVILRAEGDLDGDGKLSSFERRATATDDGELVPTGVLRVQSRSE